MDACAVAAARGLRYRFTRSQGLVLTGAFGVFQAVMPALGWLLGASLRSLLVGWAPWIAFILLSAIGGKMLYEGWRSDDDTDEDAGRSPFAIGTVLILAIATSIDALAVGVSLSLVNAPLLLPVITIGIVTFALSWGALHMGRRLGEHAAGKLDLLGGVILIGIGIKMLVG